MQQPALKRLYRAYKREGESSIFIGQGPEKFAVDDPTPEMESFVAALDGTRHRDDLLRDFPKAGEWLQSLDEAGVLEDRAAPLPVPPELDARWSRHINWLRLFDREDWSGWDAQQRLAQARVVVVGVGAGGTTLLRLLNAVGIGRLEAVDFDRFELNNLPTHTTLDEADVGEHKIDAVERHLRMQNSAVDFVGHRQRLESVQDIVEVVRGADFFCQAFDRPRVTATRWANAAAIESGVRFGGIGITDRGAAAGPIVIPGQSACYECVGMPDLEFLKLEESGALMGTTVAMLAGIFVNEIVKVITGATQSALIGRSLYVDTGDLDFTFTEHPRLPGCEACGHV